MLPSRHHLAVAGDQRLAGQRTGVVAGEKQVDAGDVGRGQHLRHGLQSEQLGFDLGFAAAR